MADAVTLELQAVSGALLLAKRTLDDVANRVGRDPGPPSDPAKLQALTNIIASSQAITQQAQNVQTIIAGTPGSAPP